MALQSTSLTRDHIWMCPEQDGIINEHHARASPLVAQLIKLIDGSLPHKSHVGNLRTYELVIGAMIDHLRCERVG